MGAYRDGETTLARQVLPALRPGMLCLADRLFFGWALWQAAHATGADLVWRIKQNLRLPRETALPDGSYLSTIYPSQHDQRRRRNGATVRVIDYTLPGVSEAEPLYRLVTTIQDPVAAPAAELAALYHERWEIETALDELKTHLRGAKVVLRSKTPDLVRQECYGFLLAHFAIRGLMHEAAVVVDTDPDQLSFVMPSASFAAISHAPGLFPPPAIPAFHEALLDELADRRDRVVSSRGRRTPRGVKRKMSKFPLRPRRRRPARVSRVTIHVRRR